MQRQWRLVNEGLFFIVLCVCIGLFIDPRLIYHGAGEITHFPVFLKGWAFFHRFLGYPGGLTDYGAAFLAQFLYFRWPGAVVLALHGLLISLCVRGLLAVPKIPYRRFWGAVALTLMLVTYNRYTFHLASGTAALVALAVACLYLRHSAGIGRSLWFALLFPVLYLATGGASLLFVVLCTLYEVLYAHCWRLGGVYLLSGLSLPYLIGVVLFNVPLVDAYTELLPINWMTLNVPDRWFMAEVVVALYLLIPVLLLVFAGLQGQVFRASPVVSRQERRAKARQGQRGLFVWLRRIVQGDVGNHAAVRAIRWLTPCLVVAGGLAWTYAPERKALFEVDYALSRQDWNGVLEKAPRYQENRFMGHALIRALCHTGRLGEDLFHYRPHPQALFLAGDALMQQHWKRIGLFWDIGAFNQCECALAESLELVGHRPILLEQLARVRMVKGDVRTASVCLNALRQNLFWVSAADPLLASMAADPNLTGDPDIQARRSLIARQDQGGVSFNMEQQLLDLLQANPRNRMANDYLLAWYALSRSLEKFADQLGHLADFGETRLPTAYEEVLLSYMFVYKKQSPLFDRVSQTSRQRFERFLKAAEPYGTDKRAAYAEMARDYGDTYFFYYIYSDQGR